MHRLHRAACGLAVAALAVHGGARAQDYAELPWGRFTSALAAAPASVGAFAMRVEPVTRAEFARFAAAHPQWQRGQVDAIFADSGYLAFEASDGDAPLQPVTSVSWFAATAYCESEGARLPRWLEWEYAAAADETRIDARADPRWNERILAWYAVPAGQRPHAVGGPANAYGLRDLHGLVWEWVEDFNTLLADGEGRNSEDADTLRSCGAGALGIQDRSNYAVMMHVALLSSLQATYTTASLGFRCVRPRPAAAP
jgi:formylglycine-generating enzyme required for sulfatase activity